MKQISRRLMGNGKGELRDLNSQVLEYLRKQYMHNEPAVCTLTVI